MKRLLIVLIAAATLAPAAAAQQLKVEPEQRYLVLATAKTGTMQKELDEVAAMGFCVLFTSPTSGPELAVFLERMAKPPDTYKYKLLATSRSATMEHELNESGAQGYRLLVRTMIAKLQLLGTMEIIAILEKEPNSTKKYEYKLLATRLTTTLQKELDAALGEGYVVLGMVSRTEHMIIMEKESS
jgi:hypothetical protein